LAYAFVVGIEQYKSGVSAAGARSDAERFSRMLTTTLGLPSDHVKIVLDERADKLGMELGLEWLARSAPKDARIYFYYSGLGAPGSALGAPHVLPHDGDSKALDATAMPLWTVLKKLGDTGAREVLAVVDTCFSGAGGRSVPGGDGRPARVVREPQMAPQVYLLSSVRGAEITHPGPNGKGGLFTHWLLEAVGKGRGDVDGDGRISLDEIRAWASPRVHRDATRAGSEQSPSLLGGSATPKADAFFVATGVVSP
jgi:uncharacterized caspase-like protein